MCRTTVGLCGRNFRRVFLDLNEALFSYLRIDKYTHFVNVHFFTFGSISPSIVKLQKATIYQIIANKKPWKAPPFPIKLMSLKTLLIDEYFYAP